jgi:hypothetical protein
MNHLSQMPILALQYNEAESLWCLFQFLMVANALNLEQENKEGDNLSMVYESSPKKKKKSMVYEKKKNYLKAEPSP